MIRDRRPLPSERRAARVFLLLLFLWAAGWSTHRQWRQHQTNIALPLRELSEAVAQGDVPVKEVPIHRLEREASRLERDRFPPDLKGATWLLDQSLAREPFRLNSWVLRARMQALGGNTAAAQQSLTFASVLGPGVLPARAESLRILSLLEDREEIRTEARRLALLNPEAAIILPGVLVEAGIEPERIVSALLNERSSTRHAVALLSQVHPAHARTSCAIFAALPESMHAEPQLERFFRDPLCASAIVALWSARHGDRIQSWSLSQNCGVTAQPFTDRGTEDFSPSDDQRTLVVKTPPARAARSWGVLEFLTQSTAMEPVEATIQCAIEVEGFSTWRVVARRVGGDATVVVLDSTAKPTSLELPLRIPPGDHLWTLLVEVNPRGNARGERPTLTLSDMVIHAP